MKTGLIFFSMATIAVLFFNACDNGSSGSTGGNSKDVLTSAEAQKQLIGNWDKESNNSKCIVDLNSSIKDSLVIDENYINVIRKEYSGKNCDELKLKKDFTTKWEYEIERVARNNNAKFIVLEKITKVAFEGRKGNFSIKDINTGEERGLAILLKNLDTISIEDGDANTIGSINANSIEFSQTKQYKREK